MTQHENDEAHKTLSGHPKPANEVITDRGREVSTEAEAARPTRGPTASACEVFREAIELKLSGGRNDMAIWQDLVAEYGFAGGYQSVAKAWSAILRIAR